MEKQCSYYSNLITAFVDAELSGPEKNEVEGHLKVCSQCNQSFLYEARIKKVVKKRLPILKAPGYLAQRIHRQLFSNKTKPQFTELVRALFLNRPLAASVAVASLLFLAVFSTYLFSTYRHNSMNRFTSASELNGKLIELQGQIFCLDCELTHGDPHNQTPHTNVHRTGIKCAANQVWTFVDSRATQELMHNHENLGRTVLVSGVVYPNSRFISVKNYRLL